MSKKINTKMVIALAEVIESDPDLCRQMIYRLSVYNPAALVNICQSVVKDYNDGIQNTTTGRLTHSFEQIFKAYAGDGLTRTEREIKKWMDQGLSKIQTIKNLRIFLPDMGLKIAKDEVEALAEKLQFRFPSVY